MQTLINLVSKVSGYNAIFGRLDGYKTKIAGGAAMLTGLAGLLNDLIPLINGKDMGAIFGYAQSLPNNQHWLTIMAGLGLLGLRHALEKQGSNNVSDDINPSAPIPK